MRLTQEWCVNICSVRPESSIQNFTGSSTLTKITRKKPVVVSSPQPRRLAGARKRREALERPYSCNHHGCGKRYSQPQNVSRHQREEHNNPHLCIVSGCEFEWTRPDEFRAHLNDCHHDVDPDKVLGKPAGARRRSKIMGRDIPPLTIESVRRSQAEPRQRSMMPALPAVANVTRVPLSTMSSVANDLQPEPAITTRKHGYARSLEFLPNTNAPSVFSSTEKCAQSVSYLDISTQCDQNWLVHGFFYSPYVISDPWTTLSGRRRPTLGDPLQSNTLPLWILLEWLCLGLDQLHPRTPILPHFRTILRSSKHLCLLGIGAASKMTPPCLWLSQLGIWPKGTERTLLGSACQSHWILRTFRLSWTFRFFPPLPTSLLSPLLSPPSLFSYQFRQLLTLTPGFMRSRLLPFPTQQLPLPSLAQMSSGTHCFHPCECRPRPLTSPLVIFSY